MGHGQGALFEKINSSDIRVDIDAPTRIALFLGVLFVQMYMVGIERERGESKQGDHAGCVSERKVGRQTGYTLHCMGLQD